MNITKQKILWNFKNIQMTIKHKCGDKTVFNKATKEVEKHSSYSEHAAMHYEGGGWSYWTETTYTVDKCKECGKMHYLKERDLL
jgi:hypothetical protein